MIATRPRPAVWRTSRYLALGLIAAAALSLAQPTNALAVGRVYLLSASLLVGAGLVRHVARVLPAEAGRRWRWRRRAAPIPDTVRDLERLENALTFGLTSRFDLRYRLGPQLRQITADLLAGRHGLDLESAPDAAAAVLDPELMALISRGATPMAGDRSAPGTDLVGLERLVSAVERI